MKKDKWVWMPHAGHFICSRDCQFHLTTYVGKYIVSTVGELWGDSNVRRIEAKNHDQEWYFKNKDLMGDDFDRAFLKRFGFREVGCGRKYETMVFKAKKTEDKCCPFRQSDGSNIDFAGYDNSDSATIGHQKMCQKWSKNRKDTK